MSVGDQPKIETRDNSPTTERSHTTKQQERSKGKERESTGQCKKSFEKKKDPTEGQLLVVKRAWIRQVLPPIQYP